MASRSNAVQDLVEACEELAKAYYTNYSLDDEIKGVIFAIMKLTRKKKEDYCE